MINQAEVERLLAIVGKLPKTADGVPVVPNDTVYHKPEEPGGYAERGFVSLDCDGDWVVISQHTCNSWFVEECFSTKRAALAASRIPAKEPASAPGK